MMVSIVFALAVYFVFVNGLKLYETKHIFGKELKVGKKYKIAYLKNTYVCVGTEEIK